MTTSQRSKVKNQRSPVSGQAMVELAVALVVILALFAGLLQVGRLANAHTRTMISARESAGRAAMSQNYGATMRAMYILNWFRGPDGRTYTADDIPFPAADPEETALEIASSARADELSAFIPDNAFSRIRETGNIIGAFFLVHGYANEPVPTFPIIRSLVYRRPAIPTESHAWLVWTRGIY